MSKLSYDSLISFKMQVKPMLLLLYFLGTRISLYEFPFTTQINYYEVQLGQHSWNAEVSDPGFLRDELSNFTWYV